MLRLALGTCAALLMLTPANAALISANFTYTGTGTFTAGETASGSGSLTMDSTTNTLTAFSFTNVLTVGANVETYTYTLADIFSFTSQPATGLNDWVFQLSTNPIVGSPNPFGAAKFDMSYSAANPGSGSTSGSGQQFINTFTTGTVTLSAGTQQSSPVPEPSTLYLTGLAGAGFVALRRVRRT